MDSRKARCSTKLCFWGGAALQRCDEDLKIDSGFSRCVIREDRTMPSGITTETRTYQMHINGEWTASKSAKTFPVYDPSTEEIIAQVPDAGPDDVNHAVAAAKVAFED